MSFEFSCRDLARLCDQNAFAVPADGMVFFGLRGCVPADPTGHAQLASQFLRIADVDFIHPRCTIGQWLPAEGKLAVFPGSTAPHRAFTRLGASNANQLLTGLHEYMKGTHMPGNHARWHKAFHKKSEDPVLRTSDDLDYDTLDQIDFVSPRDNIHAAWCDSVDSTKHAGGGCQVVVGYPKCAQRGTAPDAGPWKTFRDRGYTEGQEVFAYVLLNGYEAERVVLHGASGIPMRLRFGSSGDLVSSFQAKLKEAGFFPAQPTGSFGITTLRSVVAFQRSRFGPASGDGIVGPMTAEALGIDPWPTA